MKNFLLPTWQEKTGNSGHMTGARFPCLFAGCKISNIHIF